MKHISSEMGLPPPLHVRLNNVNNNVSDTALDGGRLSSTNFPDLDKENLSEQPLDFLRTKNRPFFHTHTHVRTSSLAAVHGAM